mgnify:CR=1 FL=1
MTPVILILAAGQSRRMRGTDKLLEPVAGEAQLRRITRAAVRTGCDVWVTLPLPGQSNSRHTDRGRVLIGLGVHPVRVADAATGMAASLRAGAAALPEGRPVLVVLADLPEITTEDLMQMLAAQQATPDMILQATDARGHPGHPVLFPPWARPGLTGLQGDVGARALLQRHPAQVRAIALPDNHATTDLDTPEDWARWRAASES